MVPQSVSTAFTDVGQSTAIRDERQRDTRPWLADNPLLRKSLEALARQQALELSASDELFRLVRLALRDVEELGGIGQEQMHEKQWAIVGRLLSAAEVGAASSNLAALLGFPRGTTEATPAAQQDKALRRLAERLQSHGVRQGLTDLAEMAGLETSVRSALLSLRSHLPPECDGALFKASPTSYFRTSIPPPPWWHRLDAETILALFEEGEDEESEGELQAELDSVDLLLRPAKGSNYWVCMEAPSLRLFEPNLSTRGRRDALPETLANVVASRKASRAVTELTRVGDRWTDSSPPEHTRPLTYAFEHPDFKAATCRVITLSKYRPGFLLRSTSAKKLRSIRRGKKSEKANWTTSFDYRAPGRHQIDAYFDPDRIRFVRAFYAGAGADWNGIEAVDHSPSGPWTEVRLQGAGTGRLLLQLPLEGDSLFALEFLRGEERELVLLELVVGSEASMNSTSVFDALVAQNLESQKRPRDVAVEATELHAWVQQALAPHGLEAIGTAARLGVAFAADFGSAGENGLLSSLSFVVDPRPLLSEYAIPGRVIGARSQVDELIKAALTDTKSSHLEELQLWLLRTEEAARRALDEYVDAYLEWYRHDPRAAGWYELYALFEAERQGSVLEAEPLAVLVSPLHPLRLAWMSTAQQLLQSALDADTPCPFPAVLNPSPLPDAMVLSCATGTGEWTDVPMLSLNTSSDYWGVLWSANRLQQVQHSPALSTLAELGIHVEGLAAGLAEGQLRRAMNDIDTLASAQAVLRLSIHSNEAGSQACTEGLARWCADTLGEADAWSSVSGRRVAVLDHRGHDRPDPEVVANLARSTGGAVEWFRVDTSDKSEAGSTIDLAILSHLGMLNPRLVKSGSSSALSEGALTRHRLRTNHAVGQELVVIESRVGASAQGGRDVPRELAALRELARAMESSIGQNAFQYAPNWKSLHQAAAGARYCAVASSDTDPSGFSRPELGAYLWDYDVPAIARHGIQDSGYYLVARETSEALSAVRFAFDELRSEHKLSDEMASQLLAEVSNRGIPSLKQLSAGGTAAAGEIGVLTALQLLQPGFGGPAVPGQSIFPPVEMGTVNLLIPVDPFRDQFEAVRKSLRSGSMATRPDLIAASIRVPDSLGGKARVHLTPIEVKYRWREMTAVDQDRALAQTASLVELLSLLRDRMLGTEAGDDADASQRPTLWGLAARSLFAGWIDFGFRVYSRGCKWLSSREWSVLHERVAAELLEGVAEVSVAPVGRLLLVHNTRTGGCHDRDEDGLAETLAVTLAEAAKILALSTERIAFAEGARAQLGDWDLLAPQAEQVERKATTPASRAGPVVTVARPANATVPSLLGAAPAHAPENNEREPAPQTQAAEQGVRFVVGKTTRSLKPRLVEFQPSNTDLSHLNVGVVGDMGTGKTQLTKYLITRMALASAQNRHESPRFLIFDYKKDYSKPDFVAAVGAKLVPPEDIPLNIMALPARPDGKPHARRDWVKRANFLYDTLSRVYGGIGPVQRNRLKNAVIQAYQGAAGGTPVLGNVFAEYDALGKPDSVSGILSDLVDLEVFTEDPSQVVSFEEFLSGVSVVQLNILGADQKLKNTLVVFFLSLFYDYMIRLPKRAFVGTEPQLRFIEAMLLVDEADNIMKYDFQVLRQILQEGREFGVGVLLASQYLSHFRRTDYDYREPLLTWFVHRVPNVVPRDLEGLGLASVDADTVNRVKELPNHEFFCTTLGEPGTFGMGRAFWRMCQDAWITQNPARWAALQEEHGLGTSSLANGLKSAMEANPPDLKKWLAREA